MKYLLFVGCAVIFLTSATIARAEPGPVVRWLLHEPASLFDIGMIKLNRTLKRRFVENGLHAYAIYHWHKNRIILNATREVKHSSSARIICSSLIERFRIVGDVNKGAPRNKKQSHYSILFTHAGGEVSDQPANYFAKLDQIMELEVRVRALDTGEEIFCNGPLLSEDVFFKE